MFSSKAYVISLPSIENPKIPAPLAENMFLSFNTLLESIISIGSLVFPVKSETILFSAFACLADVSRSKYIFETVCPVVPDEVITLYISSLLMLFKSYSLNKRTGNAGLFPKSEHSLLYWKQLPL